MQLLKDHLSGKPAIEQMWGYNKFVFGWIVGRNSDMVSNANIASSGFRCSAPRSVALPPTYKEALLSNILHPPRFSGGDMPCVLSTSSSSRVAVVLGCFGTMDRGKMLALHLVALWEWYTRKGRL
jgi:hypothetical protein